MSARPPFDVILRGPQAVADWLAQQERQRAGRADELLKRYHAIIAASGVHEKMTSEEFAIAMSAAILSATMMVYSVRGMRGPARDALSGFIDTSFDLIDDLEEKSPEFRAALANLRRAPR